MIRYIFNSQHEKMEIQRAGDGDFKGRPIIILYDDPPSQSRAYHLFDEPTAQFLLEEIRNWYPNLIPS